MLTNKVDRNFTIKFQSFCGIIKIKKTKSKGKQEEISLKSSITKETTNILFSNKRTQL